MNSWEIISLIINLIGRLYPIAKHDRDWAFTMAYNAILQATRALIFAKGFRPSTGEGQHRVAVQFAEIAFSKVMKANQ